MNIIHLNPLRWLLLLITVLTSTVIYGQQSSDNDYLLQSNDFRGSIQWEQSFDKLTWTNVANGNVPQLKVGVTKTSYFRAKVIENNCPPIFSNQKAVFIDNNFRVAATSIAGQITLPNNSNLDWSRYDVRSVIDAGKVEDGGKFNIFVTDSTQEDLLMVMDRADNSVLMLGYFMGGQNHYNISAETTALALVMMNPYAEIVPDEKKQKLIDGYKGSEEFKFLLTEVEKSIQSKKSLLDPGNTAIKEAIGRFNDKKYSGDGLSIIGPIATENTGVTASFQNLSSVSYSGMIVKKGTTQPIKDFFLAGSLLLGSDYLSFRKVANNALLNATSEFNFDFSKQNPGDYEIVISNGLNFANNNGAGSQALKENSGLLVYTFIDKLVPVSDIIKQGFGRSGCFLAFTSLVEEEIKIYSKANGGKLEPNWHVDVLNELSINVIKVLDQKDGCQFNENTRILFRTAFELYNLYDKAKKALELASTITEFATSYAINPSIITLCKFVDPLDNRVYNCFTLRKVADSDNQQAYVCDTLSKPLMVELIEDKQYYPKEEPIEGFNIFWQKPDNTFASSTTDYNGYAELKDVILADNPGEQITIASVARLAPNIGTIRQVQFKATATKPILEVKAINDIQTGKKGEKLPKPIIFSIIEGSPLNMVKLSLFDVKAVVMGGGTLEIDPNSTSEKTLGWIWTLGQEEGEQTVTFTITNKNCSPWQIKDNPITFKASTNTPNTFIYNANYYVPNTIVNWSMTLRLKFNGESITGKALIRNYLDSASVTGTINGETMNLSINYDNGVTPATYDCETPAPPPPNCAACNSTVQRIEKWKVSGTVNKDHSQFKATYTRDVKSGSMIGHADCTFTPHYSEATENGFFNY